MKALSVLDAPACCHAGREASSACSGKGRRARDLPRACVVSGSAQRADVPVVRSAMMLIRHGSAAVFVLRTGLRSSSSAQLLQGRSEKTTASFRRFPRLSGTPAKAPASRWTRDGMRVLRRESRRRGPVGFSRRSPLSMPPFEFVLPYVDA